MDEDDDTKANLDPVPALDPGLPALIEKHVPVPPILVEPVDDADRVKSFETIEEIAKTKLSEAQLEDYLQQAYVNNKRLALSAMIVDYVRAKSEKGKTLTDLMVELSHDDTFKQLLSNAL